MKKLMKFSLFICCLTLPALLSAAPATKVARQKTESVEKVKVSLPLYASPNKSAKVIDHIVVGQRLVVIYRQKDWLKVGNPENGQVGWVNIKQYQNWKRASARAFVKSVVITLTEKPDKKGKPEIIVYKNGQRLSDKDAQAFYEKMQRRQRIMQKRFNRFQKDMNRFLKDSMDQEADFWQMPFFQPVIVIKPPER